MAITTFAELKTAIGNWLADTANLTSRIPEFVSLCEDDINMDLRVREMEQTTNLTVNAQTVALPTRFAQAKRLYLDGDPVKKLEYVTPDLFWQTYMSSQTDKPDAFTIEAENFVFGPTPDSSYTGKLLYYQKLAAFSADADTNTVLTTRRGLYLFGSLKHACLFLEDAQKASYWGQLYTDLLNKANEADMRDRHAGHALTMRSTVTKT